MVVPPVWIFKLLLCALLLTQATTPERKELVSLREARKEKPAVHWDSR